jgi:hypothetical protein
MSSVIVTVDVVNSTGITFRYDPSTAARKLNEELNRARDAFLASDESFRCQPNYAGDSLLIVGGRNPVDAYWAAVLFQAAFKAKAIDRIALKIALAFGNFEMLKNDHDDQHNYFHRDLHELYAISTYCHPAGVVVTQAMHSVLVSDDSRLTSRFHERTEYLKNIGDRTFYVSNGEYRAAKIKRPRMKKGVYSLLPQTRGEFAMFVTVISFAAVIYAAYYLMGSTP